MADAAQLTEEIGGKDGDGEEDEASTTSAPPRTIWSGSLRIGLINIPVKAFSMTRNTRISFRMLHRTCQTPISFKRYCQEGEEVSLADIVYGYPLGRDKYVILGKEEIDKAKPESRRTIALDRFVNFFEADPHYFEKTYLLLPDRSEEAYSLLRAVMKKTGKAAIGRITIHSRERPVLVHYYRQAIAATTMRYPEEILDPAGYSVLRELPSSSEKEMELALEIVRSLTGQLDFSDYEDEYRKRIEALVRSKMEGMVIVPEKKREKPPARSLMEALRATADSLK